MPLRCVVKSEEDIAMDQSNRIERTFETGPAAKLEVSNFRGLIKASSWDRDEVHVVATIGSNASRDLIDVVIEGAGSHVTAKVIPSATPRNWAHRIFKSKFPWVNFEIKCPRTSDFVVQSAASHVDIQNIEGGAEISQTAGSVVIDHLGGRLDVESVSGSISVSRLYGSAACKSVSGILRIANSQVAPLSVETVSGAIDIDSLTLTDDPVSIATVSGQTMLGLASNSRCEVVFRTISGAVDTDLPFNVMQDSRRKWKAELNGGGQEISVETVSGNLDLLAAAPVGEPLGVDNITLRKPSPADVLKSLEGGNIDVDEALELLESGSYPSNPNQK